MRIPIKRTISILTLIICACCASGAEPAAAAQRHVVVIVWDGMRPDSATGSIGSMRRLHVTTGRSKNSNSIYRSNAPRLSTSQTPQPST